MKVGKIPGSRNAEEVKAKLKTDYSSGYLQDLRTGCREAAAAMSASTHRRPDAK